MSLCITFQPCPRSQHSSGLCSRGQQELRKPEDPACCLVWQTGPLVHLQENMKPGYTGNETKYNIHCVKVFGKVYCKATDWRSIWFFQPLTLWRHYCNRISDKRHCSVFVCAGKCRVVLVQWEGRQSCVWLLENIKCSVLEHNKRLVSKSLSVTVIAD